MIRWFSGSKASRHTMVTGVLEGERAQWTGPHRGRCWDVARFAFTDLTGVAAPAGKPLRDARLVGLQKLHEIGVRFYTALAQSTGDRNLGQYPSTFPTQPSKTFSRPIENFHHSRESTPSPLCRFTINMKGCTLTRVMSAH